MSPLRIPVYQSKLRSLFDSVLEFVIHIQKIVIVAISLLVLWTTACSEDPTVWSARSQSPDGRWLALAHTVRHGGFGANGVETIVELKGLTGLRRTNRVLGFANDGASMRLQMNWSSPSHLEVVYHDAPEVLYFQVVKTSGIEISVRDPVQPSDMSIR